MPDAQGFNWGNTTYASGYPKHGRFCYASTPQEGLREYLYTARLPWYQPVTQAAKRGAEATALALVESLLDEGHYTHDGHPGDDLLTVLRMCHLTALD